MRRILAILCTVVLFGGLCACGVSPITSEEDVFHLYYPRTLTDADGGDAIASVEIPWDQLKQESREQQAQMVLALLLGGCHDENFKSPIPNGTQLNSCTVEGTTAQVDFLGSYGQLDGMALSMADYCVTLSLTQLPDIYAVRITVGGQELSYRDTNRFLAGDVLLTSTDDVIRTLTARLYFPDSEGQLQPEERLLTMYEGESRAGVVISALLNGPQDNDLQPLLPAGVTPRIIRTEEGICYVNLTAGELSVLPEDKTNVINGLVNSLCSIEGVSGVQFLLDGEFQLSLGTVDISGPLTAAEPE